MPNTKYLMKEIDEALDRCLHKLRTDKERLIIEHKLHAFEKVLPAKRKDHLAFNPRLNRLYCKLCGEWYVSAWEFEYVYHDRCTGCGCSAQQIVTISSALSRDVRCPEMGDSWRKPPRHGANPLSWLKKIAYALPRVVAGFAYK